MKKLVLFLSTLLPMMVSAQESINGICYNKKSDGTYLVTKCDGVYSGEITIPSMVNGIKVTEIGDEAFSRSEITAIHLPITIEKIGAGAFADCDNMRSIEIPDNVKFIDAYAFGGINYLTDVYCYATNIVLDDDIFYLTKVKKITLHVPEANINYFKKAEQWKKIKNIVATTDKSWAIQQQEREIAEQKRIAEEQERKRIEARQKAIKDSIEARRKFTSDSLDATQGNVDAQLRMAKRYENGDGVKKDFNKAFDLYRKAAEAGNADAQYNLGTCYYNGVGTEKDVETGMEWFNKAAAQGHGLAKTRQKAYQKEKRYHGSYWIKDDNWKINFQNGHY